MSVIKLAILHVINSVQGFVQMVAKVLVLEVVLEAVQVLLRETVILARVYVQQLAKMGAKGPALQDVLVVAILDALAVVKVVATQVVLAVAKIVAIQDATSHAKMVAKSLVNPHVRVLAVVDVLVVVEVLAGDSFGLTLI